MKVYRWIQFVLSQSERGLWWDHDNRAPDDLHDGSGHGWGFVFKIYSADCIVRPFDRNPFAPLGHKWNDWQPRLHRKLLLKTNWLKYIPLPFISIALWRYGFYLGFKLVDVSEKYYPLLEISQHEEGAEYATPSVTTRTTRWK